MRAGKPIGQARIATPRGGPATVVTAVNSTIVGAATAAGIDVSRLTGVGIGFPGTYDPKTGDTLSAVNLVGFDKRFPMGSRLSKKLGGIPVVFDNDVRAAMLGEHRAGAGRPYQDLLGVFVGTGVGGGLILGGTMRRGLGAAGEIGHTVVKDGGRECGCGRKGCLEAYAGRGRMELTARKLVEKGESTILFEVMAQKGRDRLASGVIATALKRGDERMAKALIDDAVWALGISLASVQNVLDLEAIIIGGGLGDRLGRALHRSRRGSHAPPPLHGQAAAQDARDRARRSLRRGRRRPPGRRCAPACEAGPDGLGPLPPPRDTLARR